ncbi:MAG: hypothetical protein NTW46_02105 [Candidatus Nealsonbacteria bacterium]|nr:hypothetical protein [Candidatus Nealsonbacteria bacterium]
MISVNDKDLKKAIAEKLNLNGFSKKEQEKIIDKILENVSLKASILLLDRLSEEERVEFSMLKTKESVMDFFNRKTIDIYLIVDEAISIIIADLRKIKEIMK